MKSLKIIRFLIIFLFLNFILVPTYLWSQEGDPSECLKLFEETPKKSVMDKAVKNIITGAGIGAAAGYMAGRNKKDREAYVILGAIMGAAGGALYTAFSTKEFQLKEREKVIKEVGYDSSQGTYFEVLDARLENKQIFKKGEFISLLMRYRILLPDENATPQVNYSFKLYLNDNLISQFYDVIPLPQGEVTDYFVFPVCQKATPGSYILEIEATTGGKKVKRYISWEVVN